MKGRERPVDAAGKPDWQFMEDYVRGLMRAAIVRELDYLGARVA